MSAIIAANNGLRMLGLLNGVIVGSGYEKSGISVELTRWRAALEPGAVCEDASRAVVGSKLGVEAR